MLKQTDEQQTLNIIDEIFSFSQTGCQVRNSYVTFLPVFWGGQDHLSVGKILDKIMLENLFSFYAKT